MTNITISRFDGCDTVEILGHAYAGPIGADLVCAGLSALAYAMVASLRREEAASSLERLSTLMEPGYVSVTVRAKPAKRARIRGMLDACLTGFSLLAKTYPENVRIYEKKPRTSPAACSFPPQNHESGGFHIS